MVPFKCAAVCTTEHCANFSLAQHAMDIDDYAYSLCQSDLFPSKSNCCPQPTYGLSLIPFSAIVRFPLLKSRVWFLFHEHGLHGCKSEKVFEVIIMARCIWFCYVSSSYTYPFLLPLDRKMVDLLKHFGSQHSKVVVQTGRKYEDSVQSCKALTEISLIQGCQKSGFSCFFLFFRNFI